jgi:hypothetical protein
MPRSSLGGVTSAFERIQRQAQSLLSGLQSQIRTKETELRRLLEQETHLSGLLGGAKGARKGKKAATAARPTGRGRINWREVLNQLPKQFKASDIRKVRGLKDKRPSEIFAAITRWIDGGMVRRKSRGIYERK